MIEMYVIYESPADYPGRYVLRRWLLNQPDPLPLAITHSLVDCYARLPKGLICVGRSPNDNPAVREVWL